MKKLIVIFVLFSLFNISHSHAGWIGIQMGYINEKTIEFHKFNENTLDKVLIVGVIKKSPADFANLLPGDIILEINNQSINNTRDVVKIASKFPEGETVNVKILRKDSEKLIKVKLGKISGDKNFEFVEGSEKFLIFDLGMTFEVTRNIIYTKYFPKEILDKYQSDGLIVTCIDTGSMAEKIGVQLLDQVILINGKKQESYKNTTKPIELTIKRGNQIFKKTIIPTPQPQRPWDRKCTPEFSDLDCITKFAGTPSDPHDDFWVKVFECCKKNNVPVVPFHNRYVSSIGKNKFFSVRLQSLSFAITYYRYEKPKGYISKLEEYVNIAREDLKEMDKFLKLYPEAGEPEHYVQLVQAVQVATSVNIGDVGRVFKSTQGETLQTSKEDIERVKKFVLNKIETLGINNAETLDFLYSN